MLMTKAAQTDFRETPLYTATEAAHYLRVPVSTVRAWVVLSKDERIRRNRIERAMLEVKK